MPSPLPQPILDLVADFMKLPGVGRKTAEKYAFALLELSDPGKNIFARHILNLSSISRCSVCYNLTQTDPCPICVNTQREQNILCVVAHAQDIPIIEKTSYNGLYHVIDGTISQLRGQTPNHERLNVLFERARHSKPRITEIILAFNPDMDGESTVLYLKQFLKDLPLSITRLGRGLPRGADIEYADEVTITDALESRREI